MTGQTQQEKTLRCEVCGRNTVHKLMAGDIDDNPSKVCTKCGVWEEYKVEKKEDGFDRFQDDF